MYLHVSRRLCRSTSFLTGSRRTAAWSAHDLNVKANSGSRKSAEGTVRSLRLAFRLLTGGALHLSEKDFLCCGNPGRAESIQDILRVDADLWRSAWLTLLKDSDGRVSEASFISGIAPVMGGQDVSDAVTWRDGLGHRGFAWHSPPQVALVVKKWGCSEASSALRRVVESLLARGIEVWLDGADPCVGASGQTAQLFPDVPRFNGAQEQQRAMVDFIVTVGGDGTLLRTAGYFQDDSVPMPPVVSFSFGSLGFLTPFQFDEHESPDQVLDSVLAARPETGGINCTLRSRIRCELIDEEGVVHITRLALNECVLAQNGARPIVRVDCLVDGQHVTQIQGDGVILSTPTGSSAYNTAAGGGLVAPSVPCILLTAVAPHSLSMRPLVLPADATVELLVPPQSRSFPLATVDGRGLARMKVGSRVRVTKASSPVPVLETAAVSGPAGWLQQISRKLHWGTPIR
mmetsp:Transcript_1556/g.3225  ORF Transcript_1556/g.3225 Transcript_1556/m.3225 type:complete len:459 (+) Transcript_1556:32-1408(+)